MQKKLIALAVASLASGAALAQTNVTIYGVADAGYVYSQGNRPSGMSNPNFSGIQSGILSGSRLGFKGSEALGNGLKAVFTLEYSLGIDENNGVGNTGGLNARQQFVGLASDKLGTVSLGRQYAPGYLATVNNSPLGGALIDPQSFLSSRAGNTITPNSPARWDNAIAYTSPNWSGFTAKAIYGFGEADVTESTSANGKWGLGGNYSNGGLNVDLVWQTRQNVVSSAVSPSFKVGVVPGTPPTTTITGVPGIPAIYSGKNIEEGYIGASYDFKVVKVMASYQGQNDKTAVDNDNTVWTLGAVVPVMAASNIHLGYGQVLFDKDRNFTQIRDLDGDSQGATLAWTTNLSKRTTLYAGYIWVKNDKKIPAANVVTPGGVPQAVGYPGETNNTVTAGMRHTF
ncbi:MAG: Outer membrane porin protein 32 precursor [Candidatus Accumulibacter appositus]|uniref:Outer membrane porin protein 32 n=1 Tax=Candidatus Accumulibacter appositus TaxID=1454003 RepID=A0A011NEV3_9PROT|nr:porin [Accumulibacter sp.]EXI81208.1 MAG: Outer membrane porin protein 32 precursor [Candidatus Accumulibacter appositus]HRF06114.1 porin [Accumulibacter sp.]